jgi:hypothetical protein
LKLGGNFPYDVNAFRFQCLEMGERHI